MSRNHFDLDGKIAVVGGASRGIGESIAKILGEYGAHVVCTSRRLDGCSSVADAIKEAGGSASARECHMGRVEQIEQLFQYVDHAHGRVDILVNNAAANPYYGHILDTPVAAFEKTLEVNMRGYFYMCVEAGKRMREQRSGSIINVASVNGLTPGDKQAVYSMTKAGVINMSRAFANECGQFNMRINTLVPGLTKTKFAQALHDDKEFLEPALIRTPLKRSADPDEMAAAVLYLASDASSYTTGATIVVDGGFMA